MPSATEQLTKVQDQTLELIESTQKPVVDAVKKLADAAESYVPEVTIPESVPSLEELVLAQFTFAEKVLAAHKDFAEAVFAAMKPVTGKLRAQPKPKPKSTTKSTAAAA